MSIFSYVYGLRVTSGVLGGCELLPVTVLVKDSSLVPFAVRFFTASVIWMYMILRVYGYRAWGVVKIAGNPCFHYSSDVFVCYVRPACAVINYYWSVSRGGCCRFPPSRVLIVMGEGWVAGCRASWGDGIVCGWLLSVGLPSLLRSASPSHSCLE